MKQGNIIDANKKANELVHSIGVDFPKANTIINFDDSIAYTTDNVKYDCFPIHGF